MPAIAEPPAPAAPQKPTAPVPSAPKPTTPATAPKPKAEAPKPGASDPMPDLPDSDNEFFQAAQRMGLNKKKPAEPKADDSAPDAVKPPEPDQKPAAKPPEAKADPAKLESDNPKDLRFKLSAAHKELEEHKRKLAEYETKAKETKPPEEVSALSNQLAEVRKQLEDAHNEIGMLNEGATPDFKQKHQEPFNAAYGEAVQFLAGLRADDGSGNPRAGSSNDLAAIYVLPFSEARAKASQMFGEDAQYVMQHYLELHKLDRNLVKAREQLKTDWKTNQEKRQSETVQQREAFNAGYTKAKDGLTQKYPEWFGDDGSDPDVTKALSEGKRLWSQQPKTFQEHVTKAAAVELAMTAHPRLVYQLGKAKAEIESLSAKLKEFEGSEPSTTKRKTEQLDTSRKPRTASEREAELRATLEGAR